MTARDNFTRLGHMRDAASQALQFMSGETRESLETNGVCWAIAWGAETGFLQYYLALCACMDRRNPVSEAV